MKRLLLALFGTVLLAQAPKAPQPYSPNPGLWRLELEEAPGGWTTAKELTLRLKVVDPRDPAPPKPVSPEDEDAWEYREGLTRGDDEPWEAFWARVEAARKANAWRNRTLQVFHNGQKTTRAYRVGHPVVLNLDLHDGENRVEVRVPDNGQSRVVSCFATNSRDRLVVRLSSPDPEPTGYYWSWYSGGLQVVEPDSTESIGGEPTPSGGRNNGSVFTHIAPLPGTYTVRWFDPQAGVDGYGYEGSNGSTDNKPQRIFVEVLLDGGTDRERRWRFEQLVLPGAGTVTLGTLDVED